MRNDTLKTITLHDGTVAQVKESPDHGPGLWIDVSCLEYEDVVALLIKEAAEVESLTEAEHKLAALRVSMEALRDHHDKLNTIVRHFLRDAPDYPCEDPIGAPKGWVECGNCWPCRIKQLRVNLSPVKEDQ